jgi:hypothetical protein
MEGHCVVELPDTIHMFKVVGDEEDVLGYAKKHPPAISASDWSGLYMQLNARHACGTIPYRWDQGYREARLLEVELHRHPVYRVSDALMCDPTVSGADKAKWVKRVLQLDANQPLIGQINGYFLCFESESEMELIVPHHLVTRVNIAKESLVCKFRRDASIGVTTEINYVNRGWERYSLGLERDLFGENVIPSWALK